MLGNENIIKNFKREKVYFEKQQNSKLCGLHSLNSLLQGRFYDEIILSEISNELDLLEKSLYSEEFQSV
jgi:hypothetical protein